MLTPTFDKKFLFGTTMIAGIAAASLITTGSAWAQGAPPLANQPQVGAQTPPQDVTQTAQQAAQEENDNDPGVNADGTGDPNATANEVESVVVTGSRIARPEYAGTIPGVQLDSVEIDRRGFTNALDILNDVPLTGNGTAINTNGGQPSSLGVGFIDLLDLGTARTLTLVNGRRFVSGNSASLFVAGNETGGQVDVGAIPVALIERVDVLTVGGAAAYGSDAIAGVINYVLRDDFDGLEVELLGGISDRSDGGNYNFRILAGRNFFGERANLAGSYEFNHIDSVLADERDFRRLNPGTTTNWRNGAMRNPNFNPNQVVGGNNVPFFAASNDKQPGTDYLLSRADTRLSPGGTVFNIFGPLPTTPVNQAGVNVPATSVTANPPGAFITGTTQLIPGTPLAAAQACPVVLTAAEGFCAFAPTALPTGVTAAQVFTRYGVTAPAGSTAAQQTALAVAVLQANRPTPREYFAQNPNINQNLFFGSLIAPFPDVANTDPNTNRALPRVAVPLQFDANGNLRQFRVATLTPELSGLVQTAPGSEGFNGIYYTVTRAVQDRHLANVFGHFDITEKIEFFTENLFARIETIAPRDIGGLTNSAGGTTIENSALVLNLNNPFLTAQNRADLNAAGITTAVAGGNFVLGRTNGDIFPDDDPASGESNTFRTVNGIRGDFDFLNRNFQFEGSFTYGKVESEIFNGRLRDIEYSLAIDAATNAQGQIVCRSQLNPTAFIGTTPVGVTENVIRVPGAGGIPTAQVFRPTVTQDMIDRCKPLNPFGFNRMSEEAKEYVRGGTIFTNISEQTSFQGFISGELIQLPAGGLGFSVAAEHRTDELDFSTNEVNNRGRTRSAPSAQTRGKTITTEYGIEALIPIFGDNFRFPGMYSLDISPAVRFSKQDGEAPSFRNIQGQIINQNTEGDYNQIDSIAFNYRPIQDILIRGNRTKSLRNPSVTELFLGGQPAFINASTDPCSNTSFSQNATRQANCVAAVLASGAAANEAAAIAFLQSYLPNGASIQGLFSGDPNLVPEEGDSYTYGISLNPRFAPNFRASVDYINVKLSKNIFPSNVSTTLANCFDNGTFATNPFCQGIPRDNTFQIISGFVLGYQNLGGIDVAGYNINLDYRQPLDGLAERFLGYTGPTLGQLRFRLNAFRLDEFIEYSTNDRTNGVHFENTNVDISFGSSPRPEWEAQLNTIYTRGPLDLGLTWNYTSGGLITFAGVQATVEQQLIDRVEDTNVFDATAGYNFGSDEQYRVQFTVRNLTDVNTYGREGILAGANQTGYVDTLGRRFQLSLRANF